MENKRQKHDYTNEVELKSLVIREKNKALGEGTEGNNALINDLIKEYIKNKSTQLRDTIIELSKQTTIDSASHERFGEIILLMIRRILTKPNYSGYSWTDEFYSNSCYRVFKYIHNFDCDKVSKKTGQSVSAFSYITQIIMMSILEVINKFNKIKSENEKIALNQSIELGIETSQNQSTLVEDATLAKDIIIDYEFKSLSDELRKIVETQTEDVNVYYPKSYMITFDEYAVIKEILKGNKFNTSIIKLKI